MFIGEENSYNSLTIEILLHFNFILMSYRFECGLCSSVASAQLQFRPKKTQDRLIRLLVIVRLKWSEQGRMFLNQMRELRQRGKKKAKKAPPPQRKPTILHYKLFKSMCWCWIHYYSTPIFLGEQQREKSCKWKSHMSPTTLNMSWTEKGSGFSNFAALIISMSKE